MFCFGHRVSNGIDVFIHGAQALAYLSPRLNDAAGVGLLDHQEQANALKFSPAAGGTDVNPARR